MKGRTTDQGNFSFPVFLRGREAELEVRGSSHAVLGDGR